MDANSRSAAEPQRAFGAHNQPALGGSYFWYQEGGSSGEAHFRMGDALGKLPALNYIMPLGRMKHESTTLYGLSPRNA